MSRRSKDINMLEGPLLGKVFLFRNPMNLGQEAADRFYREIHTLSKAFYSAAQ